MPKKRTGKPAGRPTLYKPEQLHMIRTMAAHGMVLDEIAEALEITPRTIYNWRLKYPEIAEALLISQDAANHRVKQSLYKMALGHYALDGDGKRIFIPPSAAAGIFWAKAQMGWRDRPAEDEAPQQQITDQSDRPQESPRQVARRVLFTIARGTKGEDAA
jgi:hypothetical protein